MATKKKMLSFIRDSGYLYPKEVSINDVKKQCAPDGVLHNSRSMDVKTPNAKFFLVRYKTQTLLVQYYEEKGIGDIKNPCLNVMLSFSYKRKRK
jgi:hypothetical protein